MFKRIFSLGLTFALLLSMIPPMLAQTNGTPITPDNAATLAETIRLGRGSAEFVRFTPDGTQLIVGGSIGAWLYDVDNLSTESEPPFFQSMKKPRTIAISPDGSTLAIEHSGEIAIWDIATQTLTTTIDQAYSSSNLDYTPDGASIVMNTGSNGIAVYDLASNTETKLDAGLRAEAQISISPDGKYVVGVGSSHTLFIWDLGSQEIVQELTGHSSAVTTLSFSPDGTLVSATNSAIRLWNTNDGSLITEITEIGDKAVSRINRVVFSPDGSVFATGDGDGNILIWDTASQAIKTEIKTTGGIDDLTFSPDGSQLASINRRYVVQLWDVSNGNEIAASVGHTHITNAITFSPDSSTLAISDNAENLWLWDTNARPELHLSPVIVDGGDIGGDNMMVLEYSSDGSILASINSFSISLYDTSTHELLRELKGEGIVEALAFSPDDSLIAYISSSGLYVFNVADGALLATLENHNDWANSVAWSPDQTMIATSSGDNTVRVYVAGQ